GGYNYSYSMNEYLGSGWLYPSNSYSVAKLAQIRTPSAKVIVYDECAGTIDDGNGDLSNPGYTNILAIRHDRSVKQLDLPPPSFMYLSLPSASARGNAAFADGSVRYV